MKSWYVLGILLLVWLVLSYIIVGIEALVSSATFGVYSTTLGGIGPYATLTITYVYEVLLLMLMFFVMGVIPSSKGQGAAFILFMILIMVVYVGQVYHIQGI